MKDFNLDQLVQDYLAGSSMNQLGNQLGVDSKTVKQRLVDAGVKIRGRAESMQVWAGELDATDVIRRYLGGQSTVQIAKELYTGGSRISRILHDNNIPIRNTQEAATAAMGSPEVRAKLSTSGKKVWSRMGHKERIAQTQAAHEAVLGTTKSLETRMRSAATCQRRLSKARPNETAYLEAMRGLGYDVAHQLAVGPYNLDIALEEFGVAVEIHNASYTWGNRPDEPYQRTKSLLDHHWGVLIITYGRIMAFPHVVQKTLAFLELAGRDKPFHSQYGMFRGDGKLLTPRCTQLDCLPRVPGF